MKTIVELRESLAVMKKGRVRIGKIPAWLRTEIAETFEVKNYTRLDFSAALGLSQTSIGRIVREYEARKQHKRQEDKPKENVAPERKAFAMAQVAANHPDAIKLREAERWKEKIHKAHQASEALLAEQRQKNFADLKTRVNFIIGFSVISFAVLSGLSFYLWVMN